MANEVITYTLSPEELAEIHAKYGKPTGEKKRKSVHPWDRSVIRKEKQKKSPKPPKIPKPKKVKEIKICECGKKATCRGMCDTCYRRWFYAQKPKIEKIRVNSCGKKRSSNIKFCKIDGCDSQARRRFMCNKHYQRWLRTGSTEVQENVHYVQPTTRNGIEIKGHWRKGRGPSDKRVI